MATLSELAEGALRRLGVLAAGEVMSAEDSAIALAAVNSLLDQWAGERLVIYSPSVRTTWTISANYGEYSVGSGSDINVARPVYINDVRLIQTTPNPDLETSLVRLTDQGYADIAEKAATATLPTSWYYNPTYPTGTLKLWPVPTSSALQGALYAPGAVAEFSAMSESVSLPPGYRRMIETNLAVELGPMFTRQIPGELAMAARESKDTVKRANYRMSDLSFEAGALVGGARYFDIRTGE
ncbi:hypothetical protein [Longimicrobium sp.]|uniref:hypothetical protein n=1 Tax=Longimicrobium sp. TaxID=2029185 RepID=UPI002E3166AC|nr:hypothetical protein [Longimicrobium sp.]HEX6038915.1 hypothetical protein [Longimicrobium sp.]